MGAQAYLGNLPSVGRRTVVDEDTRLTLQILPHPGVILFPGETLPLRLGHSQLVASLRVACRCVWRGGGVMPRAMFNDV